MAFQVSDRAADSPQVQTRTILKTLRVALVLAVVIAVWAFAPRADAKTRSVKKGGRCAWANYVPKSAADMPKLQKATRCLVNIQRKRRGLKPMAANSFLFKSSDWQADDMLTHEYFDHNRQGGPDFGDRILRFGYADGALGYALGENLAWASSNIATPKKMVRLWMHSPGHRKNILTKGFRDQAVAAVWSDGNVGGAYAQSGGPFVVFVNQFGQRQ